MNFITREYIFFKYFVFYIVISYIKINRIKIIKNYENNSLHNDFTDMRVNYWSKYIYNVKKRILFKCCI